MRYEENAAPKRPFDTVLPPDARAEILQSKRPAILERPLYQPPNRSGIFKWAGGFALCTIILAGTIANYLGSPKAPGTPQQPDPVLEHSREILEHPVQPTQPSQPVNRPEAQPLPQPPRLVWEWVRSETYGPVWVQC
jgi:hypothetical protein